MLLTSSTSNVQSNIGKPNRCFSHNRMRAKMGAASLRMVPSRPPSRLADAV